MILDQEIRYIFIHTVMMIIALNMARFLDLKSLDPERQYAIISCKRGEGQNKYHMFPEDLYRTKGKVEEILKQEFRARVDEVKKDIHTLEDLLNFLYDNDVAIDIDEDDDYTDWVDRVAVQELAKEICGIELGEQYL